MYFFTIIFILFFSFFNMNIPIFKNIYYSILKNSYFYNLKSFNEDIVLLDREIRTCKSTLVTSPTLILGFTDYNEKKLKTFFQIPPFGKYEGNSLNLTDKIFIDCILFNKGFEKTLGANRGVGPNYQLRRENYLFPFMSQNNSKIYQQINFKKIGSLIKYNE